MASLDEVVASADATCIATVLGIEEGRHVLQLVRAAHGVCPEQVVVAQPPPNAFWLPRFRGRVGSTYVLALDPAETAGAHVLARLQPLGFLPLELHTVPSHPELDALVWEALTQDLDSQDSDVVFTAVLSLGELGANGTFPQQRVHDTLEPLLWSRHPRVAATVASVVPVRPTPAILALTRDRSVDPTTRAAVVHEIAGPIDAGHVERWLEDDEPVVRRAAVRHVSDVERLEALLADPAEEVGQASAYALSRRELAETRPILVRHLDHAAAGRFLDTLIRHEGVEPWVDALISWVGAHPEGLGAARHLLEWLDTADDPRSTRAADVLAEVDDFPPRLAIADRLRDAGHVPQADRVDARNQQLMRELMALPDIP